MLQRVANFTWYMYKKTHVLVHVTCRIIIRVTLVISGALYPWSPRDLLRAKAIMQYNLATAHAIRGEYEKALMQLSKVTPVSNIFEEYYITC